MIGFFCDTKTAISRYYSMKILLPSVTAHEIDLIPRFYPTTALVLSLYNESTKVTTTPAVTYVILNGILTISFTATVAEGSKYQIKLTENSRQDISHGTNGSILQTDKRIIFLFII